MIGIELEPVDSWFFRDGTPFTAGSTPQDSVTSLFPPHPPTLVGALRVALALDRGWTGRGRWKPELNAVLGDGPEDLGALSFEGPFLIQDGEPLFPMPQHLLGERGDKGWVPHTLLRPGEPVNCDLGEAVALPTMPSDRKTDTSTLKLKPGEGAWISQEGLKAVLAGHLPKSSHILPSRQLWSEEARIGLERDTQQRTAKEGMLYSTWHVRPHHGVSLGARIAGLPKDWQPPSRLVPLGGESRLASCRPWHWDGEAALKVPQEVLDVVTKSGQLMLVALSPLDLDEQEVLGNKTLSICGLGWESLAVEVVSACLQRPQRIGGWDSLNRCPLPLRSILPPGSVLFCRLRQTPPDKMARNCAMGHVGSRQEWGFGLVAVGAWPSDHEVQP